MSDWRGWVVVSGLLPWGACGGGSDASDGMATESTGGATSLAGTGSTMSDPDVGPSPADTSGDATDGPGSGSTGGPSVACPAGDDTCVALPRHGVLQLQFAAAARIADPFDTYLLRLQVEDPGGQVREVEGYFDGDGIGGADGTRWTARLTCDELGTWSWSTIEGDAADAGLTGHAGTIACVESDDLGGLVTDGRYFSLASGDPIYLVGNFLDFSSGRKSTHVYMSEDVTDPERAEILARQRDFHRANKMNVYVANVGDYGGDSVTPWVGGAGSSDDTQMDLARWMLYDGYLREIKDASMLAELWFFADDSNFGDNQGQLSLTDHQRLIRYAMARTSAFPHTLYVVALEWQEGFSQGRVDELGTWIAARDPWGRPRSVHALTGTDWAFADSMWPTFVATQAGNDADAPAVNAYGVAIRGQDDLPHLDEEYGILDVDSSDQLRARMWANFASGAAGGGTGSDLAAMQSFLADSRMPFARMEPHNELVTGGGGGRFCLAEPGHHYFVYSTGGGFDLTVQGAGLEASWYDPRDPTATSMPAGAVAAGDAHFDPPDGADWVLSLSDGSDLDTGVTHPTAGVPVVVVDVPRAAGRNGD